MKDESLGMVVKFRNVLKKENKQYLFMRFSKKNIETLVYTCFNFSNRIE